MKNTDIQKIRQLLKPILEIPWQPTSRRASGGYIVEIDADDKDLIVGSIQEALALLPCETCKGTSKVHSKIPHTCWGQSIPCKVCSCSDPCPDCQKPERECKNNKACTRYMNGTCEDCPDYK